MKATATQAMHDYNKRSKSIEVNTKQYTLPLINTVDPQDAN